MFYVIASLSKYLFFYSVPKPSQPPGVEINILKVSFPGRVSDFTLTPSLGNHAVTRIEHITVLGDVTHDQPLPPLCVFAR